MNIRASQHTTAARANSLLPVHCAWRKYGDPVIEVIGEYDNQDDLHAAEISTIAAMNTLAPNGYNIALGGGTAPSKSPSVAAKIAAKATGRKSKNPGRQIAISTKLWQDPTYRENVSAGLKASWTDDKRAANSARAKAMWDARKAAGWVMPSETKDKLAARVVSDETKAKMSASAKGRKRGPRSEEFKAAIAERTRQQWQDPEHSARRLEAIRLAKARKAT